MAIPGESVLAEKSQVSEKKKLAILRQRRNQTGVSASESKLTEWENLCA